MDVKHMRSLILLGVIASAAAGAALLPGASGSLGPAAALGQASEQTTGVSSGVATATITQAGQATEVVVRFDGDDVEATFGDRAIRVVDGAGFQRDAEGNWAPLEGPPEDGVAEVRADIADAQLLEAVRTSPTVTQDGDVYRAQLAPEQLAGIHNSLLGLGAAPPADGAAVTVEAGADGFIRRIVVESGDIRREVAYSGLGEPQPIQPPA